MSLLTNLDAYYKLDEASGNRSDSVGSNDLTDVNTVLAATGKINDGADFESSNSERLTTSTPFTTATTNFSYSFWFKAESVGAFQTLLQFGRQANFVWLYLTNASPATLSLVKDNLAVYNSSTTISAGSWYHIVGVKDGDSGTNFTHYVNGVAAGTGSMGSVSTPSILSQVGIYTGDGLTYLYPTDGIIDELGIWSRSLTSGEVSDLYNSGAGLGYDDFGGGGPAAQTARRGVVMMM